MPPPGPVYRQPVRHRYWLHIGLFLTTIASTWVTYGWPAPGADVSVAILNGLMYSLTIISILLAHEMGHYLTARHYRVPATLPYFIPLPVLSPFGTMGAVIRMGSLGADRQVLFDIGVAGPVAGLVLAIPACLIGLKLSHVVDVSAMAGGTEKLGSSLLFQWFSDLIFGKLPPGRDVLLHPIAFAGWAGLFVTSLNLLPVGQLDGGHVMYALLGRRAHLVSILFALGFLAMALVVNRSWLLMAALILAFGLRHPPTGDDTRPISPGRRRLGIALLILFFLTFTPKPFQF